MRIATSAAQCDKGTAGKDPLIRQLGLRIIELRAARRWNRKVLAYRLDVSYDRLRHWEHGKAQPPLGMLLALGRTLEISLEELISGRNIEDETIFSGAMEARSMLKGDDV